MGISGFATSYLKEPIFAAFSKVTPQCTSGVDTRVMKKKVGRLYGLLSSRAASSPFFELVFRNLNGSSFGFHFMGFESLAL